MQCSTKQHLGATKRILRYVDGTLDFGLWYSQVLNCRLFGYTDSDWAGNLDDRKSTSRNCFSFSNDDMELKETRDSSSFKLVRQHLQQQDKLCGFGIFLQILTLNKMEQLEIFCDNRYAMEITRKPRFYGRTKHVDIEHHFIRQLVAHEKIQMSFYGTNEQAADIFTKSLPFAKHQFFRSVLGVCKFE